MERTSQKSQSGQKHIVLFISALRKGGAERVMVNLADYLHRNGVRVTLVTQYICEEEYALPAGIPRILSEITPQEETGSRSGDFAGQIPEAAPDIPGACAGLHPFLYREK